MFVTTERALPRWRIRWTAHRRDSLIAAGLYLVAIVLLLFRIDRHPAYPYNWESYTIWRLYTPPGGSWLDLFAVNDGLMTDSGESPPIVGLHQLAQFAGRDSLAALRTLVVLLAGAAVPLLWIVGRRLVDQRPALLAAALLALSPVFLLYGRTATTVGLSLVPTLLTIYILTQLLTTTWGWRWVVALQGMLILSAYCYAPIRLLWPLSLFLLLLGIRYQPAQTRRYLSAACITLVALPAFLTFATDSRDTIVPTAPVDYFNARGEHVVGLSQTPERYDAYLGKDTGTDGSTLALALRLTTMNATDYLQLMLDYDTTPAITDFTEPHGSLYPAILVPPFFIGMFRIARRARTSPEDALLLLLFLGLGLPMLLSSKVHIGRLILTLPLLFLIVGLGTFWLTDTITRRFQSISARGSDSHATGTVVVLVTCTALLLGVGWTTWTDFYQTAPSTTLGTRTEGMIRDALPDIRQRDGAVLVTGEPLVSELRLLLRGELSFIDLSGQTLRQSGTDSAPPIYYGLALEQLIDPADIPNGCDNVYLIRDDDEEAFRAITERWSDLCGHPGKFRLLPF